MSKSEYQDNLQRFRDEGDINSPIVRYYRCWIDGSYNGEGHYRRNVEFVKQAVEDIVEGYEAKPGKIRDRYRVLFNRLSGHAVSEWRDYIQAEYNITPAQIDRITKKVFPWGPELRRLNFELVEYLVDLAFDYDGQEYMDSMKAALQNAHLIDFGSQNDCFVREVN